MARVRRRLGRVPEELDEAGMRKIVEDFVRSTRYAGRSRYERLLSAGVRIWRRLNHHTSRR